MTHKCRVQHFLSLNREHADISFVAQNSFVVFAQAFFAEDLDGSSQRFIA
jgi:hypothetical protein